MEPLVPTPHPKQSKVLYTAFSHPSNRRVRRINVKCGVGWGKTTNGIDLAVGVLSIGRRNRVLFLEPDMPTIEDTFIPAWKETIPPDYYSINHYRRQIIWKPTDALLMYRPRWVTGNQQTEEDLLGRSRNLTAIISDEDAIKHNRNLFNRLQDRLRVGYPLLYATLSTPKPGSYANMLKLPGSILIEGTSYDNPGIPDELIDAKRDYMSEEEFDCEVLAKIVALRGRIFKGANLNREYPYGTLNTIHDRFIEEHDWYLFCDLGSATGAYVVVQQMPDTGWDPVWTAVADLCPDDDPSAVSAFVRLKEEFGKPVAVVAGGDIGTRNSVTGTSAKEAVTEVFGTGVDVLPFFESGALKQQAFNRMRYLIKSAKGVRRFTVANNFVSLEKTGRGVREVLEEYAMRDQPRSGEFLPKGADQPLCHCADSLMAGAYKLMSPPGDAIPEYDHTG